MARWFRIVGTVVVVSMAATGCRLSVGMSRSNPAASQFVIGETSGPTLHDHWHVGFGLYRCGDYVESRRVVDRPGAEHNMHTHGDGLIHIHPSSTDAIGDKANLGLFFETIGLSHDDIGQNCAETAPAQPVLLVWDVTARDADGRAVEWVDAPTVIKNDIESYVPTDGQLLAFAVIAKSVDPADVQPPPSRLVVASPGDVV